MAIIGPRPVENAIRNIKEIAKLIGEKNTAHTKTENALF